MAAAEGFGRFGGQAAAKGGDHGKMVTVLPF